VSSAVAESARTFAANRAVGRVALTVAARDGATRRARLREEGPLRLRCPGPVATELEAVIVNTAGGVAGGDRLTFEIAVGAGARLVVTTAAAEKIYRTLKPAATIGVRLDVGADAALAWLPQETILFDRARLSRTIDVDLAEDARLLLAEAIVFGRSGMGEAVNECRLLDRWRLRREGRLIHAEALRLATVLAVPGDEATAARVRALAGDFRGEVAISAWNGFAVVRLCAADGALLRHDLIAVLTALRERPLPRLWLN
jgi:urease accessory protein